MGPSVVLFTIVTVVAVAFLPPAYRSGETSQSRVALTDGLLPVEERSEELSMEIFPLGGRG